MKRAIRGIEVALMVLEVLLSLGALAGGALFIIDPSGGLSGASPAFLEHSPFSTFLIPGLVLFTANGVFPLVVAVATLRRARWASLGHIAVGATLLGWISIQVAMLRTVAPLHGIYLTLGLVIAGLGLVALSHGGQTVRRNQPAH